MIANEVWATGTYVLGERTMITTVKIPRFMTAVEINRQLDDRAFGPGESRGSWMLASVVLCSSKYKPMPYRGYDNPIVYRAESFANGQMVLAWGTWYLPERAFQKSEANTEAPR